LATKLTNEQVEHAKRLLLQGIAPLRIARLYGCNVETIRRYKRGESRAGGVVEGEDDLRPPIETAGLDQPIGAEIESLARLQALIQSPATGEKGDLPWESSDSSAASTETAGSQPLPSSDSGNLLD